MMLFRPVEVDDALPHSFECAFHAERSDVDMREHYGDEQNCDKTVNHLGKLHASDIRPIEGKHQHIATERDGGAAEHNDPVHRFLAAVEAVSRRVVVADQAATALKPLDVDAIREYFRQAT